MPSNMPVPDSAWQIPAHKKVTRRFEDTLARIALAGFVSSSIRAPDGPLQEGRGQYRCGRHAATGGLWATTRAYQAIRRYQLVASGQLCKDLLHS